jgi:hypothetical protein
MLLKRYRGKEEERWRERIEGRERGEEREREGSERERGKERNITNLQVSVFPFYKKMFF